MKPKNEEMFWQISDDDFCLMFTCYVPHVPVLKKVVFVTF